MDYTRGDVILAKLDGYVYWPGIVLNRSNRCNEPEYQILFYGITSPRAQINGRFLRRFEGLDSKDCQSDGRYFCSYPDWDSAAEAANTALKQTIQDRLDAIAKDPNEVQIPANTPEKMIGVMSTKLSGMSLGRCEVSEPQVPGEVAQPQVPGEVAQPQVPGEVAQPQVPGEVAEPQVPGEVAEPQVPGEVASAKKKQALRFFELSDPSSTNHLLQLLQSDSDDLQFYIELVDKYVDELKDTEWLQERFEPILSKLLTEVKRYQSIMESPDISDLKFPRFLNIFTRNKTLSSVLFKFENKLLGLGISAEDTLVGGLMSLGPNQKYFENGGVFSTMCEFMKVWQSELYILLDQLLQNCDMLGWIDHIIDSYSDRKDPDWNTRKLTSSIPADVLLSNLQNILLQWCQPYLNQSSIPNIQLTYWWDVVERTLDSKGVNYLDSSFERETLPFGVEYSFLTRIFYLCHKFLWLRFSEIQMKYDKVRDEANGIKRRSDKMSDQTAKKELKDNLKIANCLAKVYESELFQRHSYDSHAKFIVYTANFLCNTAMISVLGHGTFLKYIPEYIVVNLCDYIFFLESGQAFALEDNQLRALFQFLLLFISNPGFVEHKPLRRKLVCALESLLLHITNGKKLLDEPNANLTSCLMAFVVGRGPTRSYEEINEFNLICLENIQNMFKRIMSHEQHINAIKAMVADSQQVAPGESLLAKFIYVMANDAVCFLGEALKRVKDVRESRNEQGLSDYKTLKSISLACHLNELGRAVIGILTDFTCNFLFDLNDPMIGALIAATVDFYLPYLIVDWEKEFYFYPKILLAQICKIYASMSQNDTFLKFVSRCPNSRTDLAQAAGYLPEKERMIINDISNRINELKRTFVEVDNELPDDLITFEQIATLAMIEPPIGIQRDLLDVIRWLLENYKEPSLNGKRLSFSMIHLATEIEVEIAKANQRDQH